MEEWRVRKVSKLGLSKILMKKIMNRTCVISIFIKFLNSTVHLGVFREYHSGTPRLCKDAMDVISRAKSYRAYRAPSKDDDQWENPRADGPVLLCICINIRHAKRTLLL